MAAPHFTNVDLEIESKFDLTVLKDALGRKVYDLGPGPVNPGSFLLRLEILRLKGIPQYKTPDATRVAFCSLLERLPSKAERAWRAACKKEFDVGRRVVPGVRCSMFSLRNETLRRLSALGATLGITFYHDSESLPAVTLKIDRKLKRKRRKKPTPPKGKVSGL